MPAVSIGPTRQPAMMLRTLMYRTLVLAIALGVVVTPGWERPEPAPQRFHRLGELANDEINESSGLAISRRAPNVFWTHNDSGDSPRIFAFDQKGKHLTTCKLQGARAIDWEDMASFCRGGKSWLLLADVGDNAADRPTCTLYLCEEPAADEPQAVATPIVFRYEDGPHNCEAVAVDPSRGQILLAAKVFSTQCKVYELTLPVQPSTEVAVARAIATVPVPLATSMDISTDGRRAVILTYADAFQFERRDDESWQQAFGRPPTQLAMPARRQGEAICYAADGETLYLTSESRPCPFWEVPPYVRENQPGTNAGSDK
jgi:hypothetical protein